MHVERFKYTIWAADKERATAFYRDLFAGKVTRSNDAITELEIAGGVLAIHGGGEGKRTWTGLTFQVPDVVSGAQEVRAAGGECPREPQPEDGEPPHLAMCIDPEGNDFMLSRKRG
ncbi:MAG: glyoxalase [Akkermansiaceae bacterium]|nr:glyoxalase [Akkermansiaceae bacterium]NNM28946.1 glyoxalase [Akkermansiaceae bacterium]